jgi:predicted Rdx family selenoprotein
VAAQIVGGRNREVGVTLSPAGGGRFEIYLNGEKLYDRKEPPSDAPNPAGDVRNNVQIAERVRTKLLAALEAADAAAAAAPAASGH